MGSDKALLALPEAIHRGTTRDEAIHRHSTKDEAIHRGTFVEYLTGMLANVCDEVIIVARDEAQAAQLARIPRISSTVRARVIHDLIPDTGPLMGLYTGLSAIRHTHALVTAVDMPLIQPELVTFLLSLPRANALLIPRVQNAPQVLLAVYPRSILPLIKERLDAGRRDPRSLLEVVPVHYIEEEQLRNVDPELRSFVNVNTMEEYKML
ncbi:MAG TPA: hypothetical protein DHW02_10555 [Ktedonobacter sp.]|nr:hypothetical protein [Ktedonobacter sp.]